MQMSRIPTEPRVVRGSGRTPLGPGLSVGDMESDTALVSGGEAGEKEMGKRRSSPFPHPRSRSCPVTDWT